MAEAGKVLVHWPNGQNTWVEPGTDWLEAAREARFAIPTGCLGGSCGICEITVDGETVRACLAVVTASRNGAIHVESWEDTTW